MITAIALFFIGAAVVGAAGAILQVGFIAICMAFVASIFGSKK